jgi:sarcosine oxidase subunit beta
MHRVETLIIGAGIAGASLACALAERNAGRGGTLVDVDAYGKYNSSELNGGGVRCTFAEPVNVRLSLESLRYYQQHAAKFDFRQRGYLWMYDEALWRESRAFLPAVRSFGLPVEELSPAELKARLPVLDDVSDLAGATLTPMDGRLSPHRLRIHYLDRAQAGGVELLDRWQVVGIVGTTSPFRVWMRRVPPRGVKRALTDGLASGEELVVEADRVVNAAGPWAAKVAALYGRDLPVTPVPRQVFLLRPPVDLEPLPFFIDYPQDIYFRHYEYDRKPCVLISWSDPNERPGIDFGHRREEYYRQSVEPLLVRRIRQAAGAPVAGGWTGHYELSPDKSAIVGPVPGRDGLFNLNGLSAHGVMQSRGLGVAMAGLLVDGQWPAGLDLGELSEQRFAGGRAELEKMYV